MPIHPPGDLLLNLLLSFPPSSSSPLQPCQTVKTVKLQFKKSSRVIERMFFLLNGLVLKVAQKVLHHFSFMYAIFPQLKVRKMKDIKIKPRVLILILIFKHSGDTSKGSNCRLLEKISIVMLLHSNLCQLLNYKPCCPCANLSANKIWICCDS